MLYLQPKNKIIYGMFPILVSDSNAPYPNHQGVVTTRQSKTIDYYAIALNFFYCRHKKLLVPFRSKSPSLIRQSSALHI